MKLLTVIATALGLVGARHTGILLEEARRTGVLELTSKNFRKLLLHDDLDVNIFVLASADKGFCPYCSVISESYQNAAKRLQRLEAEVKDHNGTATIFAHLMASSEKEIAMFFRLESVPTLFKVNFSKVKCRNLSGTPLPALDRVQWRRDQCDIDVKSLLSVVGEIPNKEKIAELLIDNIGRPDLKVKLHAPPRGRVILIASIGISVLFIGLYFFEFFQGLAIRYPAIIATFALVSFTLSTSGLIYNLQNGMVLVGRDPRSKRSILMSRQPRSQYVVEGLLYSCLTGLFCLALWSSTHLNAFMKRKMKKESHKRWAYIIKVAAAVLLFVALYSYIEIASAMSIKHPYLHPTFFPTAEFVRGSIRNDRLHGI